MVFGFEYENHSAKTLEKLLKKLENKEVSPGHIIQIFDTGIDGDDRWHAAIWARL